MNDLMGPRLRIDLRGDQAAQVLDAMQDPGLYTWVSGEPPTAAALQRRYTLWEGGRSPDGSEDSFEDVVVTH